jgi:hypothetical protein
MAGMLGVAAAGKAQAQDLGVGRSSVTPERLAQYWSNRTIAEASGADVPAELGGDAPLNYEQLRGLFQEVKLPSYTILPTRRPRDCPTCMPGGAPEPSVLTILVPGGTREPLRIAAPVAGGTGEPRSVLEAPELPAFLPGTPRADQDNVRRLWNELYAGMDEQHLNSVVRIVYASASRVCTGVLIAADWVITAGHCVAMAPTHVTVGKYFLSKDEFAIADDGCFLHPQALGGSAAAIPCNGGQDKNLFDRNHDLAMLHLAAAVPASLARPAALLTGSSPVELTQKFARLAGFGTEAYKPSNPDAVKPPIERLNGPAFLDVASGFPGVVHVTSATVAFVAAGDSGGPTFLACREDAAEPELLVGVNGYAYPDERSGDSATVFDVGHADWIQQRSAVTSFSEATDCLKTVARDCTGLVDEALVKCVLGNP